MIRLDRVRATAAPTPGLRASKLDGVSFVLMPGSTALLGARIDGGPLVLELCACRAKPKDGTVSVLGSSPANMRRRVAYVPIEPALPEALTASETLDLANKIRRIAGTVDARRRLERLGLGGLATRRVGTLSRAEARGLALCEALTSRADVLLIEEPYVGTCAEAAAALPAELAGCARDGRTLVIATASVRVANEMGTTLLFTKGQVAPIGALPAATGAACVRVATSSGRELIAALAGIEDVRALSLEGSVVTARGTDLPAILRAIQGAVARGDFAIESLETELASLDDARAALVAQVTAVST